MSLTSLCRPLKVSNVMSINAITSSDSKDSMSQHTSTTQRGYHPSPKRSVQRLPSPSNLFSSPIFTHAVNHKTNLLNRELHSFDTMILQNANTVMHTRAIPDQTNTIPSSPSLSATSISDSHSDFNSNGSQHSLPHSPNWSSSLYENKNMYMKQTSQTESTLDNSFDNIKDGYGNMVYNKDLFDYDDLSTSDKSSSYNTSSNKHSLGKRYGKKNGEVLATRRARNKVASAKYRAKKQALTHAMQDRIMQLATQVMSLNNELTQTKERESEIVEKYKRLVMALRHGHQFIDNNNNNSSIHLGFNRDKNSRVITSSSLA